ncbi:MAG TPA: AAA family ATPase [Chloroflexota bacterium]|nr:AAA family ATPase [Chloroflexota bacterium]
MKRVLLTGMSGTGKSTLIRELTVRGYRAIDADSDEWSEWVTVDSDADPFDPIPGPGSVWRNRDWLWSEDRMRRLLAIDDIDLLFVAGTASNQGKFHQLFDHIVLLTAPASVLVERLATRTSNSYGKHPEELARVLQHLQTVEPLLRRAATLEIDTTASVGETLEMILKAVGPQEGRSG